MSALAFRLCLASGADSMRTVDAIAAGTLKMTLITALRFNTMKMVAIKLEMNLCLVGISFSATSRHVVRQKYSRDKEVNQSILEQHVHQL